MKKEAWQNLALFSITVFYALLVTGDLHFNNFCGNLGTDYCAYWNGGRIINEHGYTEVYNLSRLLEYEKPYYLKDRIGVDFDPVPLPYLPIFLIPFQFLSLFDLKFSFLLWTLINLLAFSLYLRFFTRQLFGKPIPLKLLLMVLLSLPVFLNFNFGQLNIWLGICAGEFFRSILQKKPIHAGLWLAGWLLKPQLLILIIPFLLIRKKYKTLAAFSFMSLVIIGISFMMVKAEGFRDLYSILNESSRGGSYSFPQVMMNWRMVGFNLNYLFSIKWGWLITVLGSSVTLLSTLIFFTKKRISSQDDEAIIFFGIFAATCVITWHAHLSMIIIIIPAMIYFLLKKLLNQNIFSFFVFMPVAIHFLIYIPIFFIPFFQIPDFINNLLIFLQGLRGLVLNIILLYWAIYYLTRNSINREIGKPKTFIATESSQELN